MDFSFDLLINAVVAGVLLGGFYAAVTVGVSISFGMLDIVNIAHPAFIILGSYIAYIINISFGIDPIVVSIVMMPVFSCSAPRIYQVYYMSFEKRGQESLRGLAFFFGLLFVTEVRLILVFGVDYRYVEAGYIGPSAAFRHHRFSFAHAGALRDGARPVRRAAAVLTRTFIGRAIMAVSQDQLALQLMAATPSASSASPSAFRSRRRRLPARSSSSSSRSSRRSVANISVACLPFACSADLAACPARWSRQCCLASWKA